MTTRLLSLYSLAMNYYNLWVFFPSPYGMDRILLTRDNGKRNTIADLNKLAAMRDRQCIQTETI